MLFNLYLSIFTVSTFDIFMSTTMSIPCPTR